MTIRQVAGSAKRIRNGPTRPKRSKLLVTSFEPPPIATKDVADYLRAVFAPATSGESPGGKIATKEGD